VAEAEPLQAGVTGWTGRVHRVVRAALLEMRFMVAFPGPGSMSRFMMCYDGSPASGEMPALQ
jgi:hypothetical protein